MKNKTTIFLDPRALDVKEEEERQKQLEEQKEQEEKEEAALLGYSFVMFLAKPLVLMLLWNWTLPALAPIAAINYLQSMSIYVMSHIIFRGKK
jgi:hypothetical protein